VEHLREVFAVVCGQNHCWAPGGEVLPFCQRCTGLYVGASITVVLYAFFRPRPTSLSLWIHGLLLLLMVPFGYHLVPQNGLIRTLTGQLFAVGLIGYLGLLPASRLRLWQEEDTRTSWACFGSVLVSLGVLQVAVRVGGPFSGAVLAWLGFAGLIVLGGLVIANGILLPVAVWREIRLLRGNTAS